MSSNVADAVAFLYFWTTQHNFASVLAPATNDLIKSKWPSGSITAFSTPSQDGMKSAFSEESRWHAACHAPRPAAMLSSPLHVTIWSKGSSFTCLYE